MKSGTTLTAKFRRLKRRLQLRDYEVAGLLEMLWQATAKDAPQGDIGKLDNEMIAIWLDWEGDPDELVGALVDCSWLDESEEHRLVVHDWADHCPTYIKGNLSKHGREFVSAKEVAKEVAKESEQVAKQVTKQVTKQVAKQVAKEGAEAPCYQVKSSQAKSSQAKPSDSSESDCDSKQTKWLFSVVGNGPEQWYLPAALHETLVAAYPAVDVDVALQQAIAWLNCNPRNRKTASGMPRFLNSWMAREQNQPRRSSAAAKDFQI